MPADNSLGEALAGDIFMMQGLCSTVTSLQLLSAPRWCSEAGPSYGWDMDMQIDPSPAIVQLCQLTRLECLKLTFKRHEYEATVKLPDCMSALAMLRELAVGADLLECAVLDMDVSDEITALTRLTQLDLDYVQLSLSAFHHLCNLQWGGTDTECPLLDVLPNLSNLFELDLSYCSLPGPVDNLSQLQLRSFGWFSLELDRAGAIYNDIAVFTRLWSSMQVMTSLTELSFVACDMDVVSVPGLSLHDLNKLHQLRHLRVAQVSHVAMEQCSVPSTLRCLDCLLLDNTRMRQFHATENLTSLTRLDLCGNSLEWVPEGLCHLQGLQHLSLRCNAFQVLPFAISELTALTFLDMERQYSGIFQVEYELPLRSLRRLKQLHMRQWPSTASGWFHLWTYRSKQVIAQARQYIQDSSSDLVLLTDAE